MLLSYTGYVGTSKHQQGGSSVQNMMSYGFSNTFSKLQSNLNTYSHQNSMGEGE
jgi:hypothetical protein